MPKFLEPVVFLTVSIQQTNIEDHWQRKAFHLKVYKSHLELLAEWWVFGGQQKLVLTHSNSNNW